MDNDVLTRNENGELSVRTVSATEQANIVNPDDVYTRTTEGYLAVRTVGGSGGGGSVDYNRVVEKATTIPSADTQSVGKVYMYMGESNSTYTHGYIYEVVATQTASAVAFSGNIISSWGIEDFVSYLQEGGSAYDEITHGTLTYDAAGNLWVLVGYDSNNIEVMKFQEYTEDLEDFGCVFVSQTHQEGESCTFTMTTTESGKKWKRLDVQPAGEGGGGSPDPHNLGWYATQSALESAHPTAVDGDWAIVGATDTVWVWDSDTNVWKDTDQKGQVESVNGKTGAVVLTASDVGALPDSTVIPAAQVNSDWNASSGVAEILNKPTLGTAAAASTTDFATAAQGALADTAIQPSDLATVATSGSYADLSNKPTIPDAIQYSSMPIASIDNLGDIIQFTGTTDSSYTNAYFYKCVSDGQDPATYSWEAVEVQASSGGLPDQTGQSGKFLTTNGTNASWGSISALQNTATGVDSLTILGTTIATVRGVNIGAGSNVTGNDGVAVGAGATANLAGVATGRTASAYLNATAVGWAAKATANYAIQLGAGGTNSGANTFKVANANGNFEIMSADGTIPKERLVNAVSKPATMPELTVAGWSNNTQTVTVTGVTATNTVFVSPAPASAADYASAGIICTAQGTDSLTFTCTTVPTNAITVNVVIMG